MSADSCRRVPAAMVAALLCAGVAPPPKVDKQHWENLPTVSDQPGAVP